MTRKFLDTALQKKTVRTSLNLTERQYSMAQQIAQELGLSSFTAVMERGLDMIYNKTFPAYIPRQSGAKTKENTQLTPEQVAENKVEAKELAKRAEQARKEKEKSTICIREMFGRVEDDGNGNRYCVFPTHTTESSSDLKVPLMQASPIIAQTSIWMPSKEVVLKARPELKKLYGAK